jgi:hypothetical protein
MASFCFQVVSFIKEQNVIAQARGIFVEVGMNLIEDLTK